MQPELQPRNAYSGAGELSLQKNRVLRNTYLLLALTMVPTVVGAMVGMATGGIIMQNPIISTLVMLAVVIGLQFAIARHRNSGLGVALLLGMTFFSTGGWDPCSLSPWRCATGLNSSASQPQEPA